MAWRYSNDPDLVAKRSMDRITFAYLDVNGRIDLKFFFFVRAYAFVFLASLRVECLTIKLIMS